MLLICSDQERLLLRVTPRNLRDVTMGIEDPFKQTKGGCVAFTRKSNCFGFRNIELERIRLSPAIHTHNVVLESC